MKALYDTRNRAERIHFAQKKRAQGYTVNDISMLLHSSVTTIHKYCNGHYDDRRPGKLAPYEKEVLELRAQGITYTRIHERISEKGYTGSVASLRIFMQKERSHMKEAFGSKNQPVEYIPRKFLCQLIYKKLEKIKGLTLEQYEAAIKKYHLLGQLYGLLKEFYRIVFSQKGVELA